MKQNIIDFTENFLTISDFKAESWYHDVNSQCTILASENNLPLNVFVGMIAICSPLVKWDSGENVNTVLNIIADVNNKEHDGKFSGFSRNVKKAKKLLIDFYAGNVSSDNDVLTYVTGPKVSQFFVNILYPAQNENITIDVWMYRIYTKNWQAPTNVMQMSKKEHATCIVDYIEAYHDMGLSQHGITLNMFQSALWSKIKSIETAMLWFEDFEKIQRFV